jgi:hypothetical protein
MLFIHKLGLWFGDIKVYVVIGMCDVFIMNNHMRVKIVSIPRIQGFIKHMLYVIINVLVLIYKQILFFKCEH